LYIVNGGLPLVALTVLNALLSAWIIFPFVLLRDMLCHILLCIQCYILCGRTLLEHSRGQLDRVSISSNCVNTGLVYRLGDSVSVPSYCADNVLAFIPSDMADRISLYTSSVSPQQLLEMDSLSMMAPVT